MGRWDKWIRCELVLEHIENKTIRQGTESDLRGVVRLFHVPVCFACHDRRRA